MKYQFFRENNEWWIMIDDPEKLSALISEYDEQYRFHLRQTTKHLYETKTRSIIDQVALLTAHPYINHIYTQLQKTGLLYVNKKMTSKPALKCGVQAAINKASVEFPEFWFDDIEIDNDRNAWRLYLREWEILPIAKPRWESYGDALQEAIRWIEDPGIFAA